MALSLAVLIQVFSSLSSLLVEGDRQFAAINYPAAIACYDSVLASDSSNTNALWKIARVYVAWGEVAPDEQREQLYRKAQGFASRCITLDSVKAEGHTWRAAALGNIALFVGGKTKVRLANEIKGELDKALALKKDDDATYSILGSFYRALGSLSWIERQFGTVFLGSIPEGGYEESEASYLKAIRLAPNVPRHRYELGILYFDWNRKDEAKTMFEEALQLPVTAAGDTVARKRMIELLEELK